MTLHIVHPRISQRTRPHLAEHEHTGVNGILASMITKGFGTMWAFYLLVAWMISWMALAQGGVGMFKFDRYPFPFLLFLSNLVQLWALPVLAVGQQVLSRASDKRSEQTYKDAEAILQMADETLRIARELRANVVAPHDAVIHRSGPGAEL